MRNSAHGGLHVYIVSEYTLIYNVLVRRLSKVVIKWSVPFAYAIGLIVTDGNLSKDGRHISFTSKDKDLVVLFSKCLNVNNKVGRKARNKNAIKKYFVIQCGDKNFYEFLVSIGLMPAKSRKLKAVKIPQLYFADFLRGCIDGDGSIGIFNHPESVHPQLRVSLSSASYPFLAWAKAMIAKCTTVTGGSIKLGKRVFYLCYSTADSKRILKIIYYKKGVPRLYRKYLRARPFLGTLFKQYLLLSKNMQLSHNESVPR